MEVSFPRSHERGPIEAYARRWGLRREFYFRAHMSAAPLKQAASRSWRISLRPFPRSHERGPIEA